LNFKNQLHSITHFITQILNHYLMKL